LTARFSENPVTGGGWVASIALNIGEIEGAPVTKLSGVLRAAQQRPGGQ
jgi:hypothetical protein